MRNGLSLRMLIGLGAGIVLGAGATANQNGTALFEGVTVLFQPRASG